jgi:predicted nuclease of predicted toxin-antitoxin system
MRLLIDQNLSPYLAERLGDLFPNSAHVETVGLGRSADEVGWAYAKDQGFVILTKDEDFNEMAVIRGFPPKVIWVQLGNCTTAQVESAIRESYSRIEIFISSDEAGTFVLT